MCVRERWDACKGYLWRKSYKKLQRILDTVFKTKKEGRLCWCRNRVGPMVYIFRTIEKGIFWREEDAYDLKEFNLLSSIGLFRITDPGSWAIPFA